MTDKADWEVDVVDDEMSKVVAKVSKELLDTYFVDRPADLAFNILAATIARVVGPEHGEVHLICAMARANVGLIHEDWTSAQADEYVNSIVQLVEQPSGRPPGVAPITRH